MPTYKLCFFNGKSRAELTRIIFKQAEVDFEDIRFVMDEWGGKYKAQSPFGLAPWLEVDDGNGVRKIGGSLVIARFVAERVGLAGSNDVENSELAGIADFFYDFSKAAIKGLFNKDQAEKEKAMKEFIDTCSKWLDVVEGRIKENPSGWLYGPKLTWVDIFIGDSIAYFSAGYPPEVFEKYPNVRALREKVEAQPNIAKWIKERPKTQH